MIEFFITFLYQPFLNLLMIFYWLVGHTPIGYDMGFAVILLTLTVRIILLPLTISGHRSESERQEIERKVEEVRYQYRFDPVAQKKAVKKVMRSQPRIIISEAVAVTIQVIIALTLWRIFSRGLTGADLHLLYPWIPESPQPYNLTFLSRFDLTHPDWILNAIQAFIIFIMETIAVINAPRYVSRQEVVRVQIILPVVSFMFFAFMPAGKKLFVITTLLFSLAVVFLRMIVRLFRRIFPPASTEPSQDSGEAINPDIVQ